MRAKSSFSSHVLRRARGDDLLGEDVERPRGVRRLVENSGADAANDRGALRELVEREGEDTPLRRLAQRMAGAADALEECRDRARGPDLDDEIHVADVDAELERGRGDEGAELSGLEALFGVEPPRPGQAAVVARDRVLADQARELGGDALGHLAGVDEDERRAVCSHELGHAGVDLLPLLVGADRREGGRRDLDAEIERAESPGVDQRARAIGPDQKPADAIERLLCGREADALDRPPDETLQPLEREGEVAAALVPSQGVDLVHDDGSNRRKHLPAAGAAEQDVEGLGRRHEDVGRAARHRLAIFLGRVARAHENADVGKRRIGFADFQERALEVLLDVVREGLQGRDVQDLRLVGKAFSLAKERVDCREEGGERLARPGGRSDQGVEPGADRRPAFPLRGSRLAQAGREPRGDGGVERCQVRHKRAC